MGKGTQRPISSLVSTNLKAPVYMGLLYPLHIHGAVEKGEAAKSRLKRQHRNPAKVKLKRRRKKTP